MLGNCSLFYSRLLTFLKITFSKTIFRNVIKVPNGLNPDQDRRSVQTVCKGNQQTAKVATIKERNSKGRKYA